MADLMTVAEVATLWRVSRGYVYKQTRGTAPAIRFVALGKRKLFLRSDVQEFIARRTRQEQPIA